eukprot:TRINITY_DN10426_c0_g1_i1.p1 TRINITY_DN10426_c0_g1~~TRINITY_DN10426_c0_g1_i1.p1  ORF type:complete len:300 (-),score=79.92 TRINITY_DN10426_c0_g1_i1:132-1031(-)
MASKSCQVCRKNATNKCSVCKSAWYCSRECQKKDFKDHKIKCKTVQESSVINWIQHKRPKGLNYWPMERGCLVGIPVGTDQILLWGGQNNGDVTNEIFMFDCQKLTFWMPVVPPTYAPPARSGFTMVSLKQKVYILGGHPFPVPHFDVFDEMNHKWERIPSGARGAPPSGNWTLPSSTSCGNSIFIFGGRTSDNIKTLDNLWEYKPDTKEWKEHQKKPLWPHARSSSALGSVMERYLVLWGGDAGKSNCMNDLWIYDTQSLIWHKIETQNGPSPRGCAGFCAWKDITSYGEEMQERVIV